MDRKTTRRSALSALGTIASVTLLSASTTAKGRPPEEQRFRKLLEQANRIGNKKGMEARERFLDKVDINYTKSRLTGQPRRSTNSDDVSGEEFDCIEPNRTCEEHPVSGQIDCILNLSEYTDYSSYYYYGATFSCRLYYSYHEIFGGTPTFDGPSAPEDGIGIQWGDEEWKFRDKDAYDSTTESDHIKWNNGSQSTVGNGWFLNDVEMCRDNGRTSETTEKRFEWTDWESVTVYVKKGENWDTGDYISGGYTHTWTGTSAEVGISYPFGVSISGSPTPDQEDLATDLQTDDLEVYAQNA
jgi:hypothetical protein